MKPQATVLSFDADVQVSITIVQDLCHSDSSITIISHYIALHYITLQCFSVTIRTYSIILGNDVLLIIIIACLSDKYIFSIKKTLLIT